ncbi:hypothetical protein AIOL_001645 [Candidatus Rhodobacter oscarellae]|uniref:TIGR02453 family protein n=1 Tax=Candidatus Rhodobacter oscarellae TaxID=1675527 RepID=A0A0J9E1V2_9RHOB|nr:TIGR02453 family protein [Candidatus Rhodobacter lobularis]KMW56690.1 hypothetical protein AIOL_001645 [Candidatus Rhodobacter lobularis]
MSDGFVALVDRSVAFFAELRDNNTKDFFEPRKDFYTSEIKKPAELLAKVLGGEIGRATGRALKPKLFRIYRDVRFSKDKTPYNAHLHLSWTEPQSGAPAWFFGAAPDYLILGMGLMQIDGPALTRFRALVDAQGDALAADLAKAGAEAGVTISDWGPAPLKRVPKPYEQDHPHAALLKRKAFAAHGPLAPSWREEGLLPAVLRNVSAMLPLWKRLRDGMC